MPTQLQYDYLKQLLGVDLGGPGAAAGGSAAAVAPPPPPAPAPPAQTTARAGGVEPGRDGARPRDGDAARDDGRGHVQSGDPHAPAPAAAAPGGSAAEAEPLAGAPAGATDGPPLPATDTEIFFAKDKADLTPSDTASLDKYATAMATATDPITIAGYASVEGDPTHNSKLAKDRAEAAKQYLVGKGIDAKRITAEGHGFTGQFGEKDLPSNRRVVLAPKPAAAAPASPREYDGPTAVPAPPPPPIPRLTPQQLEDILGPDKGVPRATVQKALTDFLEQLMQQQGGKSLKLTDTVRFAARALGKGLPNELGIEGKAMGTTNRVPKELADDIAKLLPDFIPHENFDAFLKMKPKDPKAPEKFSITSALAKVLTPPLQKIIGGLPEAVQKKILAGLEDAIAKGLSSLAEKVLDENGVTGDEKKAILKAFEAGIEQKGGGDAPPGGSAEAPGGSAQADEPTAGGPAPPDATDGPPLPATDTEMFFAKDSAELTASDTASLDKYATAMSATTDPITATGYASIEGDPTHNAKLAKDRAEAVKKYLAGKGIDAGRITAKGDGFTAQFGAKDLPSNRRVVLAPKPPAKAAPATPPADEYDPLPSPDAPTPPASPPGIPRLTPQQIQDIIGEDKGEPRANVEKELAKYLTDLMTSQGGKSGVQVTDKVRVVANILAKGTPNEKQVDALVTGQKYGRVPAELAKEIAALLPDYIPRENYNKFLTEKPKDIAAPETFSIAGAIAKVLTPPIKKAISWLPETIQKKITDSIEDGIVKGLTKATEALLDENKVDGPTKDAILKAMEAAIKEKGDGGKK